MAFLVTGSVLTNVIHVMLMTQAHLTSPQLFAYFRPVSLQRVIESLRVVPVFAEGVDCLIRHSFLARGSRGPLFGKGPLGHSNF